MATRDDYLDARIDAIEDARSQTLTDREADGKAADEAYWWPVYADRPIRLWPT